MYLSSTRLRTLQQYGVSFSFPFTDYSLTWNTVGIWYFRMSKILEYLDLLCIVYFLSPFPIVLLKVTFKLLIVVNKMKSKGQILFNSSRLEQMFKEYFDRKQIIVLFPLLWSISLCHLYSQEEPVAFLPGIVLISSLFSRLPSGSPPKHRKDWH